MTGLKFTPSRLRSWSTLRDKTQTVHITGWADTGDKLVSGVPLAQHILDGLETPLPFSEIIRGLNGNFAVVVDSPAAIHTGVDAVRSIPLFYSNEEDTTVVSDDARSLHEDGRTIDDRSAVEYAAAGFVTGPHTLFHEVSGIQAGECVSWHRGDTTPRTERYYRYACTYDSDLSVELLCEQFDEVMTAVFRRLVDSLDGRQIIVPLSGGLDSRLIATTLKRLGYDNVLCLFYGLPGHPESVMSRDVAKALGYQWLHVPYIGRDWRETLDSPGMHEYWSFTSNGVSPPNCDDWPALKELRDNHGVSDDAVFVPGHTGDFISGGHLHSIFDPASHEDPHDFAGGMVRKHYSLWEDLVATDGIREAIGHRLEEVLGIFPRETNEDLARMYEYWEWQERQAKLIINSVRSYEFFGYSWRIPLWDMDVMEFWRRVPLDLKMDKCLYRRYLASNDPAALFQDTVPVARWNRNKAYELRNRGARGRLRALLNRTGPTAAVFGRFNKLRRHLRQYRHHPLGMARASSGLRYLLREPSKRNSFSLLVRDFLYAEYSLEISALLSRIKTGGLDIGPEQTDRADIDSSGGTA